MASHLVTVITVSFDRPECRGQGNAIPIDEPRISDCFHTATRYDSGGYRNVNKYAYTMHIWLYASILPPFPPVG